MIADNNQLDGDSSDDVAMTSHSKPVVVMATDDIDVIGRPEIDKRYMRFGRRPQQQLMTSADKRYMRFGRRLGDEALFSGDEKVADASKRYMRFGR